MGLDCGHLKVTWEPRATGTLYDFWKYLTAQFVGAEIEGYGGVETYTESELRDYAQEFEISPEIDTWITDLFADGDEYVACVWNN